VEALQSVAAELLQRKRVAGEKKDDRAPNFGSVVSGLIAEYGQTPDYWLSCSIDILRQRIEDAAMRRDFEVRNAARSAGVPAPPNPDSWSTRAQMRYNDRAKAFLRWCKL
jgi:hypothetical protein